MCVCVYVCVRVCVCLCLCVFVSVRARVRISVRRKQITRIISTDGMITKRNSSFSPTLPALRTQTVDITAEEATISPIAPLPVIMHSSVGVFSHRRPLRQATTPPLSEGNI